VERLARLVENAVDLDGFFRGLPDVSVGPAGPASPESNSRDRVRIGVARDRAFCFYYPENLELLEAAGAELAPFSPLSDDGLPPGIHGLYLGGGYPELSAERLARNRGFLSAVKAASGAGMPVYAECGGFMVLCRELVDAEGNTHPMAGCFPFTTRMSPRLRALGYREVVLERDCLLGPEGLRIRGHEFHYSGLVEADEDAETAYHAVPRDSSAVAAVGYAAGRTVGSYVHLHFRSAPQAARSFVDACRRFRSENRSDTP
jgi:cobyrinic acid a,c-diamide synthase